MTRTAAVNGLLATLVAASIGLNVFLAKSTPRPVDERRSAVAADPEGQPVIRRRPGHASQPCPPRDAGLAASGLRVDAASEEPRFGGDVYRDEVRDEAWAPKKEALVRERLVLMLGAMPDGAHLECRQSCCLLATPTDNPRRDVLMRDLQSSVGFRFLSESMSFTSRDRDYPDNDVVVVCFDRKQDTFTHPVPDRAVERRELMARAAPAIAKCSQLADVASTLVVRLLLDASGAVKESDREGELSGTDAARCVEKVLREEATFAPGTRVYDVVPITIELDPGG